MAVEPAQLAQGYAVNNDTQFNAGLFLLERLGISPGMHVLDVGCGPGNLTAHIGGLVGPSGRVVGVDPSSERIALAQQLAAKAGNLEFSTGRAEDLSQFPDGSFDRVFVNSTFHWVRDQARAVVEFARVLRPGGRVGFSGGSGDFEAVHERIKADVLSRDPFAAYPDKDDTGPHFATRAEMERYLSAAGLKVHAMVINKIVKEAKDGAAMIEWLDTSSSGKLYGGLPEDLRPQAREAMLREWEKETTDEGIKMDMDLLVTVATKP